MFYKLKNTLVAAVLLPLALGCKRENPNQWGTNTAKATPETRNVQQWIKNHPLSLSAQGRKAGNTLPRHTLQWAQAVYSQGNSTHTVPLLLAHEGSGQLRLQAALVANQDAAGQITGGQYVLLLPKDKANGEPVFTGLEATGFSGSVLYYNTAGAFMAGKVYEKGKLQSNATATLAARKKANTAAKGEVEADPSPHAVINNCDGLENECIEWYWQTYVNGVLVEEEYQFTTCCNTNSGGSGNNNAVAECQAAFSNFVAMGKAVNGTPTIIDGTQTATTWPKTYKWKIYDAVTWSIISIEDAIWEKKYYPSSGQNLWEFKSFGHRKIDTVGMNIGGTRKFSMSGDPQINMQRFSTHMRIDYTITHQAGCVFLPGSEAIIPPWIEATFSENVFRIPGNVTVLQANRQGAG